MPLHMQILLFCSLHILTEILKTAFELLLVLRYKLRSGQVRVFNVHIQSKLLQPTPVMGTGTGLHSFLCPGQVRNSVPTIFKILMADLTSAVT